MAKGEKAEEKKVFKFKSENPYLYVNFEVDRIQVQFIAGVYHTENEKVAEKLTYIVGVEEVKG